ncbi:hypothetical protein F511_43653 [Dorcoceras hygrometricum]|uniref:Uncharacterized protein n=1 Tax=Dorcoceras hygrometricum TaxID=472368 RepID=A0A2Z7B6P5_9LAMI|nr:hypothetical protein F511_43653 [Dorcoceras hygrometricum]
MKRRRAEESADGLALMTSSVTSSYSADGLKEQSQESAVVVIKPAAKQLTIYESLMSTAELNSNGENDKKPAKEKDASTVPLSVLYRTLLNGKNFVSNGINLNRGFIYRGDAIEEVDVS